MTALPTKFYIFAALLGGKKKSSFALDSFERTVSSVNEQSPDNMIQRLNVDDYL
jgi:hypothetical protein